MKGLVAEGYHPVSMVAFESSPDARAVYRWLGERLPGAVLELPFYGHGRGSSEEQAMRFVHGTLEHGNPLVNGYSGYRTPLHHLLAGHALQDYESYGLLLRRLRAIDVLYVEHHSETHRAVRHLFLGHRDARRILPGVEFGQDPEPGRRPDVPDAVDERPRQLRATLARPA